MQMPAWYDLYGLTPDVEEDEEGINESTMIVHSMIDAVCFFKNFFAVIPSLVCRDTWTVLAIVSVKSH